MDIFLICMYNQNTHFVKHFLCENSTVYEIMWKNMVQPEGPQTVQYGEDKMQEYRNNI